MAGKRKVMKGVKKVKDVKDVKDVKKVKKKHGMGPMRREDELKWNREGI